MLKGMQPSNAMVPARYVDSPVTEQIYIKTEPIDQEKNEQNLNPISLKTDQSKELQNVMDSDEDTISTSRSEDGTLTSDEVDQEIHSNSTVQNDKNIFFTQNCIFKVKDETPDSDQDNRATTPVNSEKQIVTMPYTEVSIKQELDPLINNENETINSKLHQTAINTFAPNEKEVCSVSSRENVLNSELLKPPLNISNVAENPLSTENKSDHANNFLPFDVIIKKEVDLSVNDRGNSDDPLIDNESETINSKLHQTAINTFAPNEKEVCSVSSRENVLNFELLKPPLNISNVAENPLSTQNKSDYANNFLPFDVIIKKEVDLSVNDTGDSDVIIKKEIDFSVNDTGDSDVIIKKEIDLSVSDASDLETAFTDSPERIIENEAVIQSSTKENSGSDNTTLKCNCLQERKGDVDKHSHNEIIVNEVAANDVIDVSKKLRNISVAPPVVKTDNLNRNEVHSDVLHDRGHNSESCLDNMKTCIPPTNSTFETTQSINQTSSSPPQLPINCDLMSNVPENSCNKSEKKNSNADERSNLPTDNFSNNQRTEIENDVYLYGCEISESMDTTSCHLDSVYSTPSLSAIVDLNTRVEATVNNYNLAVQKPSKFFTSKSSSTTESLARNNVCQESRIYDEDVMCSPSKWNRVSPDLETMAGENSLPLDLVEFSKKELSFNKDDIDKCMKYINSAYRRNESTHAFFCLSKIKMIYRSVKTNISQTVNKEMENTPCIAELSSIYLNSENSHGLCPEYSEISSISVEVPHEMDQTGTNCVPVVEKSLSNEAFITEDESSVSSDNLNIHNRSKCSELPSALENEENDSNKFTDLSATNCNEVVMTGKEKSNIESDNFKIPDQNISFEIPCSKDNEEDYDNSIRFNRIMSEVVTMHEAFKMKTSSKNVTCETESHVQSTIESTPNIPVLKIKQEKCDSMKVTNSLISDIGNSVVQLNPELSSENRNTLSVPSTEDLQNVINTPAFSKNEKSAPVAVTNSFISNTESTVVQFHSELSSEKGKTLSVPSTEELQKIIETSALLNILPPSESKSNPLNSLSKDMIRVKVEPPEIEEINLEGEVPSSVSFNVNITQPAHGFSSAISDDEIEMLMIKKKKPGLQRISRRPRKRKPCTCQCKCDQNKKVENKYVTNNHFNTVNVGYGSNTFKTTAEVYGIQTEEIDACQENVGDIIDKPYSRKVFNEDLVVKIENNDEYLALEDPNDSSRRSVRENDDKNSSSLKRKVYVRNHSNTAVPGANNNVNKTKNLTNFDSAQERCNLENESINEPPVKKLKSHQDNLMVPTTSSFISNDTNKSCFGIQKLVCETENNTKCKGITEKSEKPTSSKRTIHVRNNSHTVVPRTDNNVNKTKNLTNFDSLEERCNLKNESINEPPVKKLKSQQENLMIPTTSSFISNDTNKSCFGKQKLVCETENTKFIGVTGKSETASKRTVIHNNSNTIVPGANDNVKKTSNLTDLRHDIGSESVNEPSVRKMKPPIAHEETSMVPTNNSFITNDTNSSCFGKRKIAQEAENKKKAEGISEGNEHFKISPFNRDAEKDLRQTSLSFDQKHTLTYGTVTLPSVANNAKSTKSSANQNSNNTNTICSQVSVSGENYQNLLISEMSSCGANIQLLRQIDNNCMKLQTNIASSSAQNSSIMCSTSSKAPLYESKSEDLSKIRAPGNPNSSNDKSNNPPILFLGRKGRNRASSSNCIGRNLMDINDLPSHILEWNANWLIVQRQNKKCAPICEKYELVKDTYENELEYYTTYFPLHLLSIWLGISDSWKKCPQSFDTMFENQVEKATFVKISLSTALDTADYYNWPKREDIVLCKAIKSDGTEESLFGRICSVMVKDGPSTNNSLTEKASTMKRVRLDLFCAELLHVPILATVKVQILINMRIALLQFDALRNFNSSLKDIVYDPKKYVSRWKFIPFSSQNSDQSLVNSMRSILDSMTSRTVTVVDIPSPSDGFSAISKITTFLTENKRPIFIGLKSEESFLQLTNMLRHHNPILAIKKKEVRLPEELRQFTLEERSAVSRDIFNGAHVTLTLLPSIYLGDFTSAFADQNLTCILHDAHLCTEIETTLLLYYGVKNLVLIGNQEAEIEMHPLLKQFHYDVSLFKRFCKVISEYASS